jgi:hypothetical protein
MESMCDRCAELQRALRSLEIEIGNIRATLLVEPATSRERGVLLAALSSARCDRDMTEELLIACENRH